MKNLLLFFLLFISSSVRAMEALPSKLQPSFFITDAYTYKEDTNDNDMPLFFTPNNLAPLAQAQTILVCSVPLNRSHYNDFAVTSHLREFKIAYKKDGQYTFFLIDREICPDIIMRNNLKMIYDFFNFTCGGFSELEKRMGGNRESLKTETQKNGLSLIPLVETIYNNNAAIAPLPYINTTCSAFFIYAYRFISSLNKEAQIFENMLGRVISFKNHIVYTDLDASSTRFVNLALAEANGEEQARDIFFKTEEIHELKKCLFIISLGDALKVGFISSLKAFQDCNLLNAIKNFIKANECQINALKQSLTTAYLVPDLELEADNSNVLYVLNNLVREKQVAFLGSPASKHYNNFTKNILLSSGFFKANPGVTMLALKDHENAFYCRNRNNVFESRIQASAETELSQLCEIETHLTDSARK